MRKLLLLICALLTGVSGAWAALSSSTIAKSGNVTDTWNITSALSTDNWTAMGEGTPSGVTDLGSYTAYCRTQDITLSNDGALFITFLYSKGSDRLDILGVDLLNKNNEVVKSDYHYGYTGTYLSHNVYMLDHIASGDYKIRFIINSGVSNSEGNITIKHLNIKTASSFANITHWYSVRMNTNETHYMYYDSGASTNVAFSDTKTTEDKYLWGFVKDTDGIKIYNKAAGSSVAIDNGNPCKLSASGQTFTFATGTTGSNGAAAGAYFALYKNTTTSAGAKSYLNYNSAGIKRYTEADAGSTFMIDEVLFSEGRIYTIKAYFTSYTDLYFTNNDGTLAFNSSATNGVKDYWILRSSGNSTYPWTLESGRGDGKFLTPTAVGLSTTGGWVQINNCTTNTTYYHLYGSIDGATTTGYIRNLATWSPEGTSKKSGFAKYGSGGCYGSAHNNTEWSTDYAIEEVMGVDVYTVVCNIPSGGITYTPAYTGIAAQGNGGFYILASAPSASDFTPISVTNYTPGDVTVDASAKTITVNYTANITYTLTDANGKTYSWSASGTQGTAPTITGCDGATLTNEVWNEEARTYTADITFPFPVSSNSVTNWTYITNYSANASKFYWYTESSSATRVVVKKGVLPTNGNNTSYEWAIIPSCSNGAFSFTIKNNSTNTYVTSTSSSDSHSGVVTLSASGSSLTYILGGTYYRWKLSTDKQLSINSSGDNNGVQELGTWGQHDGTAIKIEEAEDFSTLMANLKTARTTFNNYLLPWSQGKYSETVEGTMMKTNNQQETDRFVVNDHPTAYFTAAQFKTYTDNYNNAVDGLRYVVPTFFRVKNLDGSKYVKAGWRDYAKYIQLAFSSGGTDASSIFYLNASNNIMSYYSGSYLFAINCTCPIENSWYRDKMTTYEFLPGSDVNRVYVHAASNPSNWGGEDKYWCATESLLGRVATPTANSDFLIEEVTSLPVTITAAGYATFNSPVAVSIPEGVTAFQAQISGNRDCVNLVSIDDGVIPANFPVVLKGTEGTYNFPITTTKVVAGDYHSTTLQGTIAAISVSSTIYTLQMNSEGTGVGFYEKTSGTLKGFSAYLTDASGMRGFVFNEITGIDNTFIDNVTIENAYDLSGRRAGKVKKGVYILDGKKVLF